MKKIFLLLLIAFVLFAGCTPSSSSGGGDTAYIPVIAGVSAGGGSRSVAPMRSAARDISGTYHNITVNVYWPDGYAGTTEDLACATTPIITGWEAATSPVESGETLTYATSKFGNVAVEVSVDEDSGLVTYNGTFAGSDSYFVIVVNPATNTFTFRQRIIYDLVFHGETGNLCLVNQWLTNAELSGTIVTGGFDAEGFSQIAMASAGSIFDPFPQNTGFQYWDYKVKARDDFNGILFSQHYGNSPSFEYSPMYMTDADRFIGYANMNKTGSVMEDSLMYRLNGAEWTGVWTSFQAHTIWDEHP